MCQRNTQNSLQARMLLVLLHKREILPLSFFFLPSFILILLRKIKFSTSSRTRYKMCCHQRSPWSSDYFRRVDGSQHISLRWQQRTCRILFENYRVCNSTVFSVLWTKVFRRFHLYFRMNNLSSILTKHSNEMVISTFITGLFDYTLKV